MSAAYISVYEWGFDFPQYKTFDVILAQGFSAGALRYGHQVMEKSANGHFHDKINNCSVIVE